MRTLLLVAVTMMPSMAFASAQFEPDSNLLDLPQTVFSVDMEALKSANQQMMDRAKARLNWAWDSSQ
ncbi:hypothetical protein THMIRHAS_23360 [Thiosulfatimonas sediminis]|uniref:Uncharacterized protein n=1 Tax=Thiosulfatimonas sediminis TaxID=2675054 RepID=A0A6F8PXU4_9GAMM|nr:hypothetical protein [Thiosulfatimonas sediminis]BBP46963.1 hypothetical protein THMIRHAS_23360 [Thiosulfatimonas sediminis]